MEKLNDYIDDMIIKVYEDVKLNNSEQDNFNIKVM